MMDSGFTGVDNRGRLTLIRPEYCGLGLQLMTKLSSLVDQTKLKNEMGVMKKAKKAIMEDERLLELFLISCKDNEHLGEEDDKKKMYCRLVDKVANS